VKTMIEHSGQLRRKTRAPSVKRRVHGTAATAGNAAPPTRGHFARTVALLDAALRVWEANQPQRPTVWRRRFS
jgi:hypothetical protein